LEVLSGAADCAVCLWNLDGLKLAEVKLSEAVTALSAGPLYAVAGTAHGDVQIITLAAGADLELSRPSSSSAEETSSNQAR
jgi:hypothetical protein